jgi:hypothetical protein
MVNCSSASSFIREQQIDIGAAEADHQIRIFEIGVRRLAFRDSVVQLESGKIENLV